MGRASLSIVYDRPFSKELAEEVLATIVRVTRQCWIEGWDEWSMDFRGELSVAIDAALDAMRTDLTQPDHSGMSAVVVHSPTTICGTECTVWPNRGTGELVDYEKAEILLQINAHSFYEDRGEREKVRLRHGWQACREPDPKLPKPWQQMPPRSIEYERWWRRYEEAESAKDDVGEKNYEYFMRIVAILKDLHPILFYEAEDSFTEYESWPQQKARWAREDAEQEVSEGSD